MVHRDATQKAKDAGATVAGSMTEKVNVIVVCGKSKYTTESIDGVDRWSETQFLQALKKDDKASGKTKQAEEPAEAPSTKTAPRPELSAGVPPAIPANTPQNIVVEFGSKNSTGVMAQLSLAARDKEPTKDEDDNAEDGAYSSNDSYYGGHTKNSGYIYSSATGTSSVPPKRATSITAPSSTRKRFSVDDEKDDAPLPSNKRTIQVVATNEKTPTVTENMSTSEGANDGAAEEDSEPKPKTRRVEKKLAVNNEESAPKVTAATSLKGPGMEVPPELAGKRALLKEDLKAHFGRMLTKKELEKIIDDHGLALHDPDGEEWTFLRCEISNKIETQLGEYLAKTTLKPSRPQPAAKAIVDSARLKHVRWPVFMLGDEEYQVSKRCVLHFEYMAGKMVKSELTKTIRSTLQKGKTVLLGGPSGGGKTMIVLGLVGDTPTSPWVVVYATATEFTNARNKTPDNHYKHVLEVLVSLVEQRIKPDSLAMIKNLEAAEELHIVVALDEMGGHPTAMRAMCAIGGERLRTALGLPESVRVHLVAAGTGIGIGDTPPGSLWSRYEILYVQDEDRSQINEDIFLVHLGFRGIEVSALAKPLRDAIRGNARMAAILGRDIGDTLLKTFGGDALAALAKVDLLPFLSSAIFTFKSMNALDTLVVAGLERLLIASVRAHFFPHAPCLEKEDLERRYGLIVDMAKWVKEKGEREPHLQLPAYSRYHLPGFSIAALATLTGLSSVTKSVASGASLEEYSLAVLHLVACAAGSAALFGEVLKQGSIAPLNHHVPDPRSSPFSAERDFLKELPPSSNVLVNVVKDLSTWQGPPHSAVGKSDVASCDSLVQLTSSTSFPKSNIGSHYNAFCDKVVQAVSAELAPLARLNRECRNMVNEYNEICQVAAFRSLAQAPFADLFIFVDDTLFEFQAKDCRDGWDLRDYDLERYKMGASDDQALRAYAKDMLEKLAEKKADDQLNASDQKALLENWEGPQKLLVELAKCWHAATGIKLTKVQRCFITPKPVTKSAGPPDANSDSRISAFIESVRSSASAPLEAGGYSIKMSEGDMFVSVEDVEFLKFDPSRDEPAPRSRKVDYITLCPADMAVSPPTQKGSTATGGNYKS